MLEGGALYCCCVMRDIAIYVAFHIWKTMCIVELVKCIEKERTD